MLLVNYLNGLGSVSNEDLVSHFLDRFGVNVKIENDLYLFKYGQLEAKWIEPITHECRGVILRKTDNGWVVVCLPPNKFFNQHEGHCPIFKEDDFNARCELLSFVEKCDGTGITIWNDNGNWRVSTLGTITPMQCGDSPWTFEHLFWNIVDAKYPRLIKWLEDLNLPGAFITIFCELCSEENRVVTRYSDDRIYLLCVRRNDTGEYLKFLGDVAEETGLHLPARMSFSSVGVDTLEKAKDFVESESKKIDQYGEYPEGMVVVDNSTNEPICKMKNSLYLQLHHAIGAGDTRCTRNRVIEAFFCGNMDDLYPVLTPSMQEFADKLRDWWVEKIGAVLKLINSLKGLEFDSMKDYALYVKDHIAPEFQPLFFKNKLEVAGKVRLDDSVDSEKVSKWMVGVYKKFETELKSMSGI